MKRLNRRSILALFVALLITAQMVRGHVASAASATLTLTNSDGMLRVVLDTGTENISAFSFTLAHGSNEPLTCQSDISRVNCNPDYLEGSIRANYYSAQEPLFGSMTLLEIPVTDTIEFCIGDPYFVTDQLQSIIVNRIEDCSDVPLAVSLVDDMDASSWHGALIIFALIVMLIWVTRTAWRIKVGLSIICGLLLTGIVLSPSSPASAQTSTSELGDLNCDSNVDILDALLVELYMNGTMNGENGCPANAIVSIHIGACDTNFDIACTSIDAEMLADCDIGFTESPFCRRVPNSYLIVSVNRTIDIDVDVSTLENVLNDAGMDYIGGYYNTVGVYDVRNMTPVELRNYLSDPRTDLFSITFNTILTAFDVPSWGLDRIDQPQLPLDNLFVPLDAGDNEVDVYVMDTGILSTHIEFTGRIGDGATFVYDGLETDDCTGHGTHVAGTIGGETVGVASRVVLHPVRVLDCDGKGTVGDVIAGIDWINTQYAVSAYPTGEQRPAIVNMSLGGTLEVNETTLDDAVRASIDRGITYVVAAGNETQDACRVSPARVAEAITVGATQDNDYRAGYSNYGSCVDLFAPGSDILSAGHTNDSDFTTINGTSMAAPHVSGAIARLLSNDPFMSPEAIADTLINTAIDNILADNVGVGSPNKLLFIGDNDSLDTPSPIDTPLPLSGTRYVAPAGSDESNPCTIQDSPCATIDHALNQVTDGETIRLAAGTYNEFNIIDGQEVTIIGDSPETTIVDSTGFACSFFLDNATVIFGNLTISGALGGIGISTMNGHSLDILGMGEEECNTPTPLPTDTPTLIPTDTPMPPPTNIPTPIPTALSSTNTPTPLQTDIPTPIPTDTPLPLLNTRYVAPTGSDESNSCTVQDSPCATIAYALSQAMDGETIQLAAGTYNEFNVIDGKDITIRGDSTATTIIDSTGFACSFFLNNARLTFQRMTVIGTVGVSIVSGTSSLSYSQGGYLVGALALGAECNTVIPTNTPIPTDPQTPQPTDIPTPMPTATSLPVSGTRYVSPTGSDASNSCDAQDSPCETIAHALSQAIDGETIQLAAGTYNEFNVIDGQEVTIRGDSATTTTIDSAGFPCSFSIANTTVTFEYITILGTVGRNGNTTITYRNANVPPPITGGC